MTDIHKLAQAVDLVAQFRDKYPAIASAWARDDRGLTAQRIRETLPDVAAQLERQPTVVVRDTADEPITVVEQQRRTIAQLQADRSRLVERVDELMRTNNEYLQARRAETVKVRKLQSALRKAYDLIGAAPKLLGAGH